MKGHFRDFLQTPLMKNTLKLSSSSAILLFLPLAVTPILSRLYTPEEYAIWGVFSSVISIVSAIIFLSYENTIVRSNEDWELPNLILLCVMVCSVMTSFIAGFFYLGRSLNIQFFTDFPNPVILAITLWTSAIFILFTRVANRFGQYGIMSLANIANGFSQGIIRILLGYFPILPLGLIYGNIFAHIIAAVYLGSALFPLLKLSFSYPCNFHLIINCAKKYKKFPLFDAPSRCLEFTVVNVAVIILSLFWGKTEIGCFTMVHQFLLLPITVLGSAMGNVYYRELSENVNDIEIVQNITRRVSNVTFFISILPILFLTLGGDKLLVLFLGTKWIAAGKMALCLAIYSVPVIMTEPLMPIFRVFDKQEQRLKYNILNLIFSIVPLIFISIFFNKNVYIALLVYSVGHAFVRFFIYFKLLNIVGVNHFINKKVFHFTLLVCYTLLGLRLIRELISIY